MVGAGSVPATEPVTTNDRVALHGPVTMPSMELTSSWVADTRQK